MAYCGPRGIPHSTFLGRIALPDEPVWLPRDRELALEWAAEERAHCQCGTRRDEWVDEHGKRLYPPPFVVEDYRCPGCELIEQTRRDLNSDEGVNQMGVKLYLAPFDPDAPIDGVG